MKKTKPNTIGIGSNQDYMAESDARTLAEGAAIRNDPKRHKKAALKAAMMAESKMAEAKELKKLGNRPRF